MGFQEMCYSLTLNTHACAHTRTQKKKKTLIKYRSIENFIKVLRPDSLQLIPKLVNLYLRSNTQVPGLTAIRTTLKNQDLCRNNSQLISTETGSILPMIS